MEQTKSFRQPCHDVFYQEDRYQAKNLYNSVNTSVIISGPLRLITWCSPIDRDCSKVMPSRLHAHQHFQWHEIHYIGKSLARRNIVAVHVHHTSSSVR